MYYDNLAEEFRMKIVNMNSLSGAIVVALGLCGLYHHVEYSGWALFIVLLVVVN